MKVGAGGTAQTTLELGREAVSLLAWAIDHLGDLLANAGFHSTSTSKASASAGAIPSRRALPRTQRITTTLYLSLDPNADEYVREIFGNRWRVLDHIERLPEQLPMLYLSLTS
jgi:hypothetical protein